MSYSNEKVEQWRDEDRVQTDYDLHKFFSSLTRVASPPKGEEGGDSSP